MRRRRRRKQTGTMVQTLLFRDSSQQKTKTEFHVAYCTEQVNSLVEHLCAENNFQEFVRRDFPQYLLETAGRHQKYKLTNFFLPSFLYKSASLPLSLHIFLSRCHYTCFLVIFLLWPPLLLSLHVPYCHCPNTYPLIVVLPCILVSTKLFCQQIHSLLKHKMLQFIFKISFLIWLLHVSVSSDHHQGAYGGTLLKLQSL